jgi:hypothetical protein
MKSCPCAQRWRASARAKFRQAIADAFRQGDGVLEARRESALFLSTKTA